MRKEWIGRPTSWAYRHPTDAYLYIGAVLSYGAFYLFVRNFLSAVVIKRLASSRMEPPIRKKFHRALCKLISYGFLACCAMYCLVGESWPLSSLGITMAWPGNNTPPKVNFYYVMEAAYYTGSYITMFVEEKQSDFYLMVWHHFATLVLLIFSYRFNFLRHGIFIMAVHDVSDPWMEAAKLAVYLGYQTWGNVLFAVFTVMFIVPRIIIYPIQIVVPGYTYLYEYEDKKLVPIWILLLCVFLLNFYWSILIVRMLVEFVRKGKVERDIRDIKNAEGEGKKPAEREGERGGGKEKEKEKGRGKKEKGRGKGNKLK